MTLHELLTAAIGTRIEYMGKVLIKSEVHQIVNGKIDFLFVDIVRGSTFYISELDIKFVLPC